MGDKNNHKFDEEVRKAAQGEFPIPPGFDWDEMDIATPSSKRRKRRFFYYALFLLLICSSTAGIMGLLEARKGKSARHDKVDSRVDSTVERFGIGAPKTSPSLQDTVSSEHDLVLDSNSTGRGLGLFNAESGPDELSLEMRGDSEPNQKASSLENHRTQTENQYSSSHLGKSFEVAEANVHETDLALTELSRMTSETKILRDTMLLLDMVHPGVPRSAWLMNRQLKVVEDNSLVMNEPNTTSVYRLHTGLNTYRLVDSKVRGYSDTFGSNAIGFSFGFSRYYPISEHLFTRVGITLDQLHYFYQEEAVIGSELNAQTLERIEYTQVLKHHNSNWLTSLDLAFGRSIIQAERLELSVAVAARPGIVVHKEGRFISEETRSVRDIESDAANFGLSAGIGLEFRYQLWEQSSLFIEPNYSRNLIGYRSGVNSAVSVRPEVLNFNIGLIIFR
jgi:hypothetical protein